jgi:hypothetical protein
MSKKPIAVDTAMRNMLQQLQQDPLCYKLFGIYWWPMKDFLKAAGYGKDQLYMLGDYRDAITADLVPAWGRKRRCAPRSRNTGAMSNIRTRAERSKILMASW